MKHVLTVAVFAALTPALAYAQDDLSDAEVAHIAVTANHLDAMAAEQALEKSTHPEVRQFASTMIRDHEGVIEAATALAERLGVTPADNAHSRSFISRAGEARERHGQLSGTDFDQAYIAHEVAFHEAVIAAVRGTLVPTTSNGELKALLESVLPALETHLAHARSLASELGQP